MPDDTLLTWSTGVTVRQVKDWIAASERQSIAEFLAVRFTERYLAPVNAATNGFFIMAASCLLIEALESYRQGWPSSERMGDRACIGFFEHFSPLNAFKSPTAQQFYKHVRCGILHQGETTGGWTITRLPSEPLIAGKRLNAAKFHFELGNCLSLYVAELKAAGITDEKWTNCLMKLHATIRNCD